METDIRLYGSLRQQSDVVRDNHTMPKSVEVNLLVLTLAFLFSVRANNVKEDNETAGRKGRLADQPDDQMDLATLMSGVPGAITEERR